MQRRTFLKNSLLAGILVPVGIPVLGVTSVIPDIYFVHSYISMPSVKPDYVLPVLLLPTDVPVLIEEFPSVYRHFSAQDILPAGYLCNADFRDIHSLAETESYPAFDSVADFKKISVRTAPSRAFPVACEIHRDTDLPSSLLKRAIVILPDDTGVIRELLLFGVEITDLPSTGILAPFLSNTEV